MATRHPPLIHALPSEILVSIFKFFPGPTWRPEWLDTPLIINVTHVCRRWRDVALANPRLWIYEDITNADSLSASLQRSNDQSLWIRWDIAETSSRHEIFEILAPHCGRIHEFFITTGSEEHVPTMLSLLALTSDRLSYLSLTAFGQGPDVVVVPDNLLPNTVRLTHLVLEGIRFPSRSPIYATLRELKLYGDVHLPSNTLLDILECCPRLEKLKLSDTGDFESEGEFELPTRTVSLPLLKKLHHCDYYSDVIGNHLACLSDLPSRMRLTFEFNIVAHRSGAGLLDWIVHTDSKHPILSQIMDVKVVVRHSSRISQDNAVISAEAKRLASDALTPGVEIRAGQGHDLRSQVMPLQRNTLRSFPRMFEGSVITSVTIEMSLDVVDGSDWLEALSLLPALTELSVTSLSGDTDVGTIGALFEVLTPAIDASPHTLLVPQLKNLTLVDCKLDRENVVRTCLEERMKSGSRLEYLGVSYYLTTRARDVSMWMDVKDIIGALDFTVVPRPYPAPCSTSKYLM